MTTLEPPSPPSIAQKAVRGSAYSVAASAVTILLGAVRTYLMVLFLLPDEIGLAALAVFYVDLGRRVVGLGIRSAYIQQTDSGEPARRTFIAMSLIVGLAGLGLVALLAPVIRFFYPAYTGLDYLIWFYAGFSVLMLVNQVRDTFLEKDMAFGQIAAADILGALTKTITGPTLAYLGYGVWAIMGEFAVGTLTRFSILQFFRRHESFRPGWDRNAVKHLWEYGRSVWVSSNLAFLIDNFDDFWVGTALGKGSLGLYNKAYEFSRYPRRVVANPILSVFFPTFARLQDDRIRLSRAFFRAASLVVRFGALLSLTVILAAPEAFRLFLPGEWQPMRLTFQLMILYTFLDPLNLVAQDLLFATGHPGPIARVRRLQFLVFVPAVILGARFFDIEGVALAADVMILVGTVILFRQTASVVDYSARTLWFWPVIAMAWVFAAVLLATPWLGMLSDLPALLIKIAFISLSYTTTIWVAEKEDLKSGVAMILDLLRPKTTRA